MKANLNYSGPALTTEEWEHEFGISVQRLRLARKMTQIELAKSANISIGSVQNLEAGKGSSLRSVIAVARALGRSDWLSALTEVNSSTTDVGSYDFNEVGPLNSFRV